MLFYQAPANCSEQESDPPSRRLLGSPLLRPLGQTRFRDNQPRGRAPEVAVADSFDFNAADPFAIRTIVRWERSAHRKTLE